MLTHGSLRYDRKKILHVTVSRSHKDQLRKLLFQLSSNFHLPRHANQRIFRRQISIRRGIQRRPLHMWIVIRTACGDIHKSDVQLFE
ncbi:MAG: hypothetical protein AUG74_13120 [Bacteroidetes bacterium 13_1_20CM_4_60_6]|nr:MAG: hypothetical protein AUG74_13120 [Bacteroidetes bacterium 13_1_20CM_4_60_6]